MCAAMDSTAARSVTLPEEIFMLFQNILQQLFKHVAAFALHQIPQDSLSYYLKGTEQTQSTVSEPRDSGPSL